MSLFGNLVQTIDPRANVIGVGYDLLGRRLQLIDPDLGVVKHTVDPLGRVFAYSSRELQARTDGNISVKMVYAAMGRCRQMDTKSALTSEQSVSRCSLPPATRATVSR